MAEASQGENEDVQMTDEDFLKNLSDYMKKRGTPIPPPPTMNNKPFDLYSLYKHVTDRGGLENVLKERLWASIVPLIELPPEYAYERKNFLYIEDEDEGTDYTPKVKSISAVPAIKPITPSINRSSSKLDYYRRTPLPAESVRLRNRLKDTLQLQKICFALKSRSAAQIQWGMEVLAMKTYEGEITLRGNTIPGNDDVTSNVGTSLLSCLADLAQGYFSVSPFPLWKSEKAPESPNEAHILTILRNLTLVPTNDVEIASHNGILEFLILSLSHPSPACVEDALETFAALSFVLVLGWEGDNNNNNNNNNNKLGLSSELSKVLVQKISSFLGEEGFASATLHILANLTGQVQNWPHLETILTNDSSFFGRLDSLLNSGAEDLSTTALKIIFNISKYGIKTKQQMGNSKGIMLFLVRFLSVPRSEDEMDDELVLLVVDILFNFGNDPSTKSILLQYESDLLNVILLESGSTDVVANILSTLAP